MTVGNGHPHRCCLCIPAGITLVAREQGQTRQGCQSSATVQWQRPGLRRPGTDCSFSYQPFLQLVAPTLTQQQDVMVTTTRNERLLAESNKELGPWAIFQGRNLVRFVIAGWPKIVQQFVGLSVFNTYAVYFCEFLAFRMCITNPFAWTDLALQSNTPATRILFSSPSSCPASS